MSGFEVLEQVGTQVWRKDYLLVLILKAMITPQVRRCALRSGAKDFVGKPFDRTEVELLIRHLLHTRALHRKL